MFLYVKGGEGCLEIFGDFFLYNYIFSYDSIYDVIEKSKFREFWIRLLWF